MRQYFMVGNKHEGCGHRHRTLLTALSCLVKVLKKGERRKKYSVYRVTYQYHIGQQVRRWERVPVGR